MPGQADWPGYAPQREYPQPGYQPPTAYQQQQAALGVSPALPGAQQQIPSHPLALLLGVAGGVVAALIGALAWAFLVEITQSDFYFSGIALGILVGGGVALGVALGSQGQNRFVLAIIAALLGLLSFLLALYFSLSLATADVLHEGTNLFALPLGDFFDALTISLQNNPFNYANFVLVPLCAALTAFNNNRVRLMRRHY